MNALTNTAIGGDTPPAMTSREIAELLNVRHDSVRRTIERLAEKGVIACPPLVDVQETGGNNRKYLSQEYVLSGEQGKRDSYVVVAQLSPEFTARLVDRWQELENTARFDPARALADPGTLRALLLENVEKVLALESKVEADAPKVAFAESVSVAPDAISLGQAAKILNTGRNRLSAKLRELGWLTRLGEPYQTMINQGFLDVKIGSWEHPQKGLQRSVTALVTGKGLSKLHQVLGTTSH